VNYQYAFCLWEDSVPGNNLLKRNDDQKSRHAVEMLTQHGPELLQFIHDEGFALGQFQAALAPEAPLDKNIGLKTWGKFKHATIDKARTRTKTAFRHAAGPEMISEADQDSVFVFLNDIYGFKLLQSNNIDAKYLARRLRLAFSLRSRFGLPTAIHLVHGQG
jgi:hypothetical protein